MVSLICGKKGRKEGKKEGKKEGREGGGREGGKKGGKKKSKEKRKGKRKEKTHRNRITKLVSKSWVEGGNRHTLMKLYKLSALR